MFLEKFICVLFYHVLYNSAREKYHMKIAEPFRCDRCTSIKGPSNHWFLGTISANGITVTTWSAAGAKRKGTRHLCGIRCATSFAQEELSKFGTAPSKPAPVIPASPNEAQEQEAIHKAGFSHNAAAPVVDVDISDDKGWNE
jgi:hypothetical protein